MSAGGIAVLRLGGGLHHLDNGLVGLNPWVRLGFKLRDTGVDFSSHLWQMTTWGGVGTSCRRSAGYITSRFFP
jgi:hypothetical protein